MTFRAVALSLVLAAAAGGALAEDSHGIQLTAENEAKIKTMLTEQGYEVRKVQIEDGSYEAYALKGGKKYEIYMDAQFQVVNVKED